MTYDFFFYITIYFKAQRNDTTRRIEAETLKILKWENPIRSGAIFSILLGSIILTSSYSLLQIISSGLTIAILLNLIYVCGTGFFQTVVADHSSVNPYRFVLHYFFLKGKKNF